MEQGLEFRNGIKKRAWLLVDSINLVSNPEFVAAHLAQVDDLLDRLILCCCEDEAEIAVFTMNGLVDLHRIPIPSELTIFPEALSFVGDLDGLVCVNLPSDVSMAALNPILKTWKLAPPNPDALPKSDSDGFGTVSCGFGRLNSGVYVFMRIWDWFTVDGHVRQISTCPFDSDTWTITRVVGPSDFVYGNGHFTNGMVHFFCSTQTDHTQLLPDPDDGVNYVVGINPDNHEHTHLDLPPGCQNNCLSYRILSLGQKLGLFSTEKYYSKVWILDDYPDPSTWKLLFNLPQNIRFTGDNIGYVPSRVQLVLANLDAVSGTTNIFLLDCNNNVGLESIIRVKPVDILSHFRPCTASLVPAE